MENDRNPFQDELLLRASRLIYWFGHTLEHNEGRSEQEILVAQEGLMLELFHLNRPDVGVKELIGLLNCYLARVESWLYEDGQLLPLGEDVHGQWELREGLLLVGLTLAANAANLIEFPSPGISDFVPGLLMADAVSAQFTYQGVGGLSGSRYPDGKYVDLEANVESLIASSALQEARSETSRLGALGLHAETDRFKDEVAEFLNANFASFPLQKDAVEALSKGWPIKESTSAEWIRMWKKGALKSR